VADTFGDEILAPHTMNIDRQRLAAIVFNDKQKLAALNAIVHPVIVKGIADRLEMLRGTDSVVVLDAALLVELGMVDLLDALIVVTANADLRKERLRGRGMRTMDIDARIAAQASEERLLEKADIVVTNDGSPEDLATEADRIWQELEKRRGP
jgi:dephospho-CoA kinase